MKRELEPIELIPGRQFWENVFDKTDFDTDVIVPIEVKNDETGEIMGKFYISLENEEKENFIQLEDFSSTEFAELFFQNFEAEWIILPGGIYRVKI